MPKRVVVAGGIPVKIHPASAGLPWDFTARTPMQNTKFRAQGPDFLKFVRFFLRS